jgi:hypothetical protein
VRRCLILAPTRELAKQVASEFESVCPALTVVSFYGGTSIVAQIDALRRGVDVVVGTPGRLMDLLDRKKLNGSQVRCIVTCMLCRSYIAGSRWCGCGGGHAWQADGQEEAQRIAGGCCGCYSTIAGSRCMGAVVSHRTRTATLRACSVY